ncbi:FHA domain-containing serine/threonine-protein kinase [Desulfobacterales bacterium HSG2]|nr:FHA domain-containing serine/threonine-protein kinase [Desulfobacterales bacterium HSG2]
MHVEVKVTAGPAKGQTFAFHKPDCFLFGRAADARISLTRDPYVSRQHFLLEISPPECRVTDLDSKNGVFVNGIRYGGRRPPDPDVIQAPDGAKEAHLKNGDELAVGDTMMTIFIKMNARCSECGKKMPDDKKGPICRACREKQQQSSQRSVHCAYCDRDVTDEVGARGHDGTGEYVCDLCQTRDANNPMDLLKNLLRDAAVPKDFPDMPTFRGYRIENELGRGGMSVVYKALEEETGRIVAIKTMRPQVAVNEENIRIFRREIKITRQLRHKNIVEIFKYGKSKGVFFFVLELVDGMDLDVFIKSKGGRIEIEEAAPIMLDILEGLAYAHRVKIKMKFVSGREKRFTGIVHRDIKPQNILLARNENGWTPKIVDFGLSKSFESAGLTNMTVAGQVAGTPIYWPREQITHYKYLNPATDVFSIAAVFYEMLTGSYVREGFREMFAQCQNNDRFPGIADFMRIISENPPVPLCERQKNIPEAVAAVIDRALKEAEVPPDEAEMRSALVKLRYPDAGIFRDELAKAFKKAGLNG